MICEWCGKQDAETYCTVILPEGCCSYLICGDCAATGEERGGGLVVCHTCGRTGRRGDFTAVTSRKRYRRWRRRIKVTTWECPEGMHEP